MSAAETQILLELAVALRTDVCGAIRARETIDACRRILVDPGAPAVALTLHDIDARHARELGEHEFADRQLAKHPDGRHTIICRACNLNGPGRRDLAK